MQWSRQSAGVKCKDQSVAHSHWNLIRIHKRRSTDGLEHEVIVNCCAYWFLPYAYLQLNLSNLAMHSTLLFNLTFNFTCLQNLIFVYFIDQKCF